MNAQHTPGPWKAERFAGESNIWADRKGPAIAYRIGVEEDARLIAAAPELLEALRAVVAVAGKPTELRAAGYDQMAEAVELARAALAKAEDRP